jgi:protein-disulfide isomerase
MPSGKKARQKRHAAAVAARTPPPVRSKGGGGQARRQASPRSLGIAGGVVLIAIVAIVLGVVLGSGGGNRTPSGTIVPTSALNGLPAIGSQNWAGAEQGAQEANNLFKGIPQNGLFLGKPSAPVTMEMFIDVQCPVCDFYEINYLPTIVKSYIRPGKVRLHLQPWAFLGPQSFTGRLGLIAAASQNLGFEYAKVLYDNQGQEESGWLTGQMMAQIGASVTGLDMHRWLTTVNGSRVKSVAGDVDKLAKALQVTGTPTVLVGRTGTALRNVLTAQQISQNDSPNLQETEAAFNAALK